VVARLFVGDPGSGVAGPWLALAANGAIGASEELTANSHWVVGAEEIAFDRTPTELRKTEPLVDALKGSPTVKQLLTPPAAPPKKAPPKKASPASKAIAGK
jgi:hypothetical protein